MQRRNFVKAGLLIIPAGATFSDAAWAANPPMTTPVQTLAQAIAWLDTLQAPQAQIKTTGAWPLVAVLEHLAQSIEMSLDGFPQPKSALFQNTVGAAAFAVFGWAGKMRHGLDEPIPGAPALTTQGDWNPAAQRLRQAIARFDAHTGPLQAHFAYGKLSKTAFAQAHVFHIANHQDEIAVLIPGRS
jgi:hypothetical protein